MLEPINRGWRINYANEFHLDITPAVLDSRLGNGAVLVPDRKLEDWKESHPKGYAAWFEGIAATAPGIGFGLVTMRAEVEPLPENQRFRGPLRRIVQILKRHRDVYFSRKSQDERDRTPISIVVTTLATRAYEQLVVAQHFDTEFDLMVTVGEGMQQHIGLTALTGYSIPNPSNPLENFAEKWNNDRRRADAFFEWHKRAVADVKLLAQAQGLDRIGQLLSQMLGEDASRAVLNEYTDRMSKRRNAGLATVPLTSGALGLGAAPHVSAGIRPNTFFGSE